MYTTILFDLDGTLIDSEPGITSCAGLALEHFGIHETDRERLRLFIGPPLKDSFKDFYGFDDEMAETAVKIYRARYRTTGLFEGTPYPGIEEMLKRLKASDKTVCLATSKPIAYAERILEHFGLSGYFDLFFGNRLDKNVEKSDMIKQALIDTQTEPGRAVMVGDRCFDICAAREAGIACIGVSYGFAPAGELEAYKADKIVSSAAELAAYLTEERS